MKYILIIGGLAVIWYIWKQKPLPIQDSFGFTPSSGGPNRSNIEAPTRKKWLVGNQVISPALIQYRYQQFIKGGKLDWIAHAIGGTSSNVAAANSFGGSTEFESLFRNFGKGSGGSQNFDLNGGIPDLGNSSEWDKIV